MRCFAFRWCSTRFGTGLRALMEVTLVAMALVARLAILVTAAGTPYLDELGFGRRSGSPGRRSGIGGYGGFRCSSLGGSGFHSLGGRSISIFSRRREARGILGRDGSIRRCFERRL